jgi:sugar phosphate permease
VVHAVGIAFISAPGTVAIMHGIPEEHAGTASGLFQKGQQIDGALGIAVLTAIYTLAAVPGRLASGLPTAFLGGAIIAFFAAVIGWRTIQSAPCSFGDGRRLPKDRIRRNPPLAARVWMTA